MRIFNPCKKCIVRACCKTMCQEQAEYYKTKAWISQNIDMFIWLAVGIISGSTIASILWLYYNP